MGRIIKRAIIDSLATTLYIILVSSFMFFLQGNFPGEDIILMPIAMLLLFVFSAALTGFLVFGKPIMMYIDGKKKEAVLLISLTLAILFIMTAAVFAILLAFFSFFA